MSIYWAVPGAGERGGHRDPFKKPLKTEVMRHWAKYFCKIIDKEKNLKYNFY
jgi:hypothetical protein